MSLPVFLLITGLWSVFTWFFISEMNRRGFSRHELDEFLRQYAERSKSLVGQAAQPPAIVRRSLSFWQPYLEGVGIVAVNIALPLALFSSLEVLPAYLLFMGFVFLESTGTIFVRLDWTPRYRADFERYLVLTAPENQCIEGELIDADPEVDCPAGGRFLSGGKIITLAPLDGVVSEKEFPLFCPQSLNTFPQDVPIRIFYRPSEGPIEGRAVVGALVGWQPVPDLDDSFEDSELMRDEFERRLIEN